MGKGDIKSKRGKLFNHSYGKKRKKRNKKLTERKLNRYDMIRTFCAVGKGGFTIEKFQGFTMVYDCGGTSKPLINGAIDRIFPKKNTHIDAVFISHLHCDHINGLEYLLDNYDVDKLFLPYLNEGQKLIAFIQNAKSENSDLLEDLILKPESVVPANTKIVYVNSNGESNNNSNESLQIESLTDKAINSGQILTSSKISTSLKWIFLPFNLDNDHSSKLIKNKLKAIGVDVNNIRSEFNSKKVAIIEIYEKSLGGKANFNTNSLVLYSGFKSVRGSVLPSVRIIYKTPAGCLYLGDYIANPVKKMQKITDAFNPYWDFIGTVQIPHHGTPSYYNSSLNKNPNIVSVIFDSSLHPHRSTTPNVIRQNNGIPIIVDEHIINDFEERISC